MGPYLQGQLGVIKCISTEIYMLATAIVMIFCILIEHHPNIDPALLDSQNFN